MRTCFPAFSCQDSLLGAMRHRLALREPTLQGASGLAAKEAEGPELGLDPLPIGRHSSCFPAVLPLLAPGLWAKGHGGPAMSVLSQLLLGRLFHWGFSFTKPNPSRTPLLPLSLGPEGKVSKRRRLFLSMVPSVPPPFPLLLP